MLDVIAVFEAVVVVVFLVEVVVVVAFVVEDVVVVASVAVAAFPRLLGLLKSKGS